MLEVTLVYGFVNSVILALTALGFSLTFGISGVANFAYGALYVLAGYAVWIGMHKLGLPFVFSAVLAVALTALVGAALYRLVVLRVRGMEISEVIATFGVGMVILELFRYLGFTGYEYTLPVFTDGSVEIWGVYVDHQRLWIVGIGIALAVGIYVFTKFTKIGLAFRGIAQDERTALSLGMNSDRIAEFSVAFGAALAAIAAIVILPRGTISVNEGYSVLLNAMAVCIVGGLGSTAGVVVASFIIGYAQMATDAGLPVVVVRWVVETVTSLLGTTIPDFAKSIIHVADSVSGPHGTMIVSLVAILLVLVIKPSGLFGKQKELEERI